MGAYTAEAGLARFQATYKDAVFRPRGRTGRRLVVLCHAFGQLADAFTGAAGTPQQTKLATELARRGLTLVAAGLSGDNWGNASGTAQVESIRAAAGSLGCLTDKLVLVGVSHGHSTAWGYRRDYPSKVAAIAGIIPACDLDDVRNNNRASARASIDAAWGVTYPAALPAGANLALNTGTLSGIPSQLYYSTGDTVVIPSTVTAFATGVGGTATVIGSADHSDADVAGVDVDALAAFCIVNGA